MSKNNIVVFQQQPSHKCKGTGVALKANMAADRNNDWAKETLDCQNILKFVLFLWGSHFAVPAVHSWPLTSEAILCKVPFNYM